MNIRTEQSELSPQQKFNMIRLLYIYSHFLLSHTPDDIEFNGLHPLVIAVVDYLKKRKQPQQALKAFIRSLSYLEKGKFSPMVKLLNAHHGEELLKGLFACVKTPEQFGKITLGIRGWYATKEKAIRDDYTHKTNQNIASNIQHQNLEKEYNEILMEEEQQKEIGSKNKPQTMQFLSQNKDFFLSTYSEVFASWVEKSKCEWKPIVKQFSHELSKALKVAVSPARTNDNVEVFKILLKQIDQKPELMGDFLDRNEAFLVVLNEVVHSAKIQECIHQWYAIHPHKRDLREKKMNANTNTKSTELSNVNGNHNEGPMEVDAPNEEKEKEEINKTKRKVSNYEMTLFHSNKKSNLATTPTSGSYTTKILKKVDLNL